MNADVQLIIVAGGMGNRLGHSLPKALVPVSGTPLIVRTVAAFEHSGLHQNAIIVHPIGFRDDFQNAIDAAFPKNTCALIEGGQERADSVAKGLGALDASAEIVVIHDAARPFVDSDTIQQSIESAQSMGACTVACACKDTVLQVSDGGFLTDTPDRATLRLCQTPQVFKRTIIESAYAAPASDSMTDDATRVQRLGHPVCIVEAPDTNIKITTPQDIEYAEFLLSKGIS